MSLRTMAVVAILVGCTFSVRAGVGESAVITLAFPFGARATGMGEVGTALADDESALYFNPAGLGLRQNGWRRGAGAYSFEYLLPAFGLSDLWHASLAGYYQAPGNIGGFGTYANYINMGENPITDEIGREKRRVNSWEGVYAIGWGFSFREFGDSTRYAGLAIKPFVSALAPGLGENGEGVGQGVAFDLGYLRVFGNGVRLGLNIANMGRSVYYVHPGQRDPLPFTVNTAIAWKKRIVDKKIEYCRLAAELRLDKELVVNHFDGNPEPFYKAMIVDLFNEPVNYELQEINYHAGFECWIFNTGCWRQGILFDYLGERYELTTGFGVNLFNHLRGGFSWIYAPEGYMKELLRKFDAEKDGATGARNYQWRLTITVDALGGWSKADERWWKVNKKREMW